MVEHIINFAINFEDDKIVKIIEENASKQIINDLKFEVLNRVMTGTSYYRKPVELIGGEVKIDKSAALDDWVKDLVKKTIEDNKEEIIERAVDVIATKYIQSKAFKEKIAEVL